jgi:RHS repeat-associated protein
MSNANGQKVETSAARYLPYDRWRTEPTANLTDRAYTGQKHNMDIGLYYYNARYYAPGTGRFVSADTLVPDPTNPQQFNRYAYGLNNPLRFIDPTGHCVEAFEGATREDNLQSGDSPCWNIYYNWLDKGYRGLNPAWEYYRDDLWFIEELYLQYDIQFIDGWDHQWSADQTTTEGSFMKRCYGTSCSVSYQRLLISTGGAFLTLKMNGEAAWLFQSFYTPAPVPGLPRHRTIRGIGTDTNGELREAMQSYGTAHTNYWNAVGNTWWSGAGFAASIASTPFTNYGGLAAAGISARSYLSDRAAKKDARQSMSMHLGQANQQMYALQVRIND